ncbi:undecaprenyl-diphosphate phosphatase [Candidatus Micrarchaeota archaeon]|nr:undecaprenyl-diphosphate phosphatase [Candidatus Micrarchaeota archaeon]
MSVNVFQAIFLGVIQGITEWLPVSSSGHLALVQYFFGIGASVELDILLHFGTLLAVIAYFRKDIHSLFSRFFVSLEERALATNILIAAVPTALIAFAFKDFFEALFLFPAALGVAFIVTGVFLIIASKARERTKKISKEFAFAIGVAQGISVAPGISRSGATIGTAILLGIEKREAAKFSFLIGAIAVLGASLFEGRHAVSSIDPPALIGALVAAIVGYASIAFLLRVLERRGLRYFGYYCIFLGVAVLLSVTLLAF